MAYVQCPCGFRADTQDDAFDDLDDCAKAFEAHGCEYHQPKMVHPDVAKSNNWSSTVGFFIFCLTIVALCLILKFVK